MTEMQAEHNGAGRIEGGIDAIVIGAGADGLTAAAYLGKAGLKTVLLEAGAEIGGPVRAREFAPDANCIDGEHLLTILDPNVIADLDLYRFGLAFAARRLDTVYFFEDGGMLRLGGDLETAAQSYDENEDGAAFHRFITHALEAADHLRAGFETAIQGDDEKPRASAIEKAFADGPNPAQRRLNQFALAAACDVIGDYLPEGPLQTAMLSEAAFRSSTPPHEAFSFMGLVRRWAGEAAGLQGAIAYPEGGMVAVVDALRRAVQAAKVEIRAATAVKSILIECDRAAGVELVGGGQIRAPIIVASLDARRVFMDMIGPANIDIDFQRAISMAQPRLATARLHVLVKGAAKDEKTKDHLRCRIVYAPPADALRRAFTDARAGEVPDDLILECVFPWVLDGATEANDKQIISVMAHPLPFDAAPDEERRSAIKKAILGNLNKFFLDVEKRIKNSDLRLPADTAKLTGASPAAYAAKPGMMQQWALSGAVVTAGNIGGLYFCGPEAQIGAGLNAAAGRIAGQAAVRAAKRGGLER